MNCLAGSDDWQHSFGDRREDGSRYPVQLRMDGRGFARFHVDIAVGDEVLEPLEIVTGESWLGFGAYRRPLSLSFRRSSNLRKSSPAYTLPQGGV
jgi:hypothetical protein